MSPEAHCLMVPVQLLETLRASFRTASDRRLSILRRKISILCDLIFVEWDQLQADTKTIVVNKWAQALREHLEALARVYPRFYYSAHFSNPPTEFSRFFDSFQLRLHRTHSPQQSSQQALVPDTGDGFWIPPPVPEFDLTTLFEEFFYPYIHLITFEKQWRTQNVLDLARTIDESLAFEGMPILADAIEEAGCVTDDILKHCRESPHHTRGCWVIDLIPGRT